MFRHENKRQHNRSKTSSRIDLVDFKKKASEIFMNEVRPQIEKAKSMQQPYLRIFAGCNGSGQSNYSTVLSPDAIPFDYDKRFLAHYNSMRDSELRE